MTGVTVVTTILIFLCGIATVAGIMNSKNEPAVKIGATIINLLFIIGILYLAAT